MFHPAEYIPFDPTDPNDIANRRVWVRYLCSSATPGQAFNTSNYTTQHGRVLNLSSWGLGLLLDLRVGPGTLLKVEVEGWNGNRMLLGRVMHATESGEGWLHGCELVNPVNGTELQDLLG
jgi:hypothetical protein